MPRSYRELSASSNWQNRLFAAIAAVEAAKKGFGKLPPAERKEFKVLAAKWDKQSRTENSR